MSSIFPQSNSYEGITKLELFSIHLFATMVGQDLVVDEKLAKSAVKYAKLLLDALEKDARKEEK